MMLDRKQVSYILKFIALCWTAIAAVIGIVVGLSRILKDTTLTIIVVQVVIYSCLFGYLGWQQYKWKGDRKGWGLGKDNSSWGGRKHAESKDTEESESGWK
jgi:hypothetical protein